MVYWSFGAVAAAETRPILTFRSLPTDLGGYWVVPTRYITVHYILPTDLGG